MENNNLRNTSVPYAANSMAPNASSSPTPLFADVSRPAPLAAQPVVNPGIAPSGSPGLNPLPSAQPPAPIPSAAVSTPPKPPLNWKKLLIRSGVVALVLLLVGAGVMLFNVFTNRGAQPTLNSAIANTNIPLSEFANSGSLSLLGAQSLSVNGQLRANESFILAPQAQPVAEKSERGQLYYDSTINQLAYYNGTRYVQLPGTNASVQTFQGQSGNVTLVSGNGITVTGTTISNSGVTSFGGQTGDITLGGGLTMNGGTLQNTGLVTATSGSPSNLSVVNDGNGNITISSFGAGTGTVQSSGGTAGHVALFTAAQTIQDSIITQSGTTVTVGGNLSVTGNTTLTNALTVANGGTGAQSFTLNAVIVGNGASQLTSVAAGGAGLCLLSTLGAPTFAACPGGGVGVTALDGLTGSLTLANSTGSGTTITIDDATTGSAKGIASFDSANFTASGGVVNTIQAINTGATPTFAGVNTNTVTPSSAMTLGISAQTALLQGSTTTITSSGAGGSLILNSGGSIELQDNTNITGNGTLTGDLAVNGGDITSTGALNITPTGALTAGSTLQTLTLQGNAATTLKSTSGANTTTVAFTSPTAATTLNFPALAAGTYTICTTSGNCAGAGVTLQNAYNNSSTPELVLDATRAALTIRDNASAIGGNLFEVQNNAGSTTYFGVTATGATVTGTATVSGNINSSGGVLQTGGATRIDNSGNASNIGSLTLSGAISGGTSFTGSGNINTTAGVLQTASTTRVDNSGNLVNIAAITASGSASIQGGTVTLGTNSQAGSLVINDGSSNTGTVQVAALGQNTTFTLPDPGAGTATICLSTGNCASSGGGVTTLGGTAGTIPVFTGTQAIGDSLLSQAGGTVTLNGNLNVSSGVIRTAGTVRLDNSGNLSNIGTLTLSGAISGGTSFTGSGNINTTAGVLQTASTTRIDNSGNLTNIAAITASGSATLQGGNLTLGTTSQAGGVIINDGSSNIGTLKVAAIGQDTVYTLPDAGGATATICLTTGNCAGTGTGVTTVGGSTNRLAKFTGAQAIADSTITDNGTTVTTSVNMVIQGGTATLGTTSQTGSLVLHDGNGQTTTFQAGNSAGNLTFILPTTAGSSNQCLKQSGSGNQLIWDACDGGGGGVTTTLQQAYNNGNTILATDNRDLLFTLPDTATDSSFVVNLQCASGCGSNGHFAVQDGGVDVFSISPAGGAVSIKNTTDSTQAFNIKNSSNNNLFTVDTANSRVGIALGANNTPSLQNSGVQIAGSLRLSGSAATNDLYVTPLGTSVGARISVENYTIGDSEQVIALGVTSGSHANARGITVADARSVVHQPSIGVLSPDQASIGGFSWEGSNSDFYVKNTASGTIKLSVAATTRLSVTTTGADVNGVLSVQTLGSADNTSYLCRNTASQQIASCNTTGTGVGFVNGGNSFAGTGTLGTNDNNQLDVRTNGTTRFTIGAAGGITLAAGNTFTVQGGSTILGTTSQQGSLAFHDGNGQTATISVGSALVANTALAIPTGVGTSDTFCLLTLANCTGGTVSSIGTIDSQTKSANGAVIASNALVLQTADASAPGLVSTVAQTFSGAKTFGSNVTVNGSAADALIVKSVDNGSGAVVLNLQQNDGDSVLRATDTGTLAVGNATNVAGTLSLAKGTGSIFGEIKASNLTAFHSLELPDVDGTICTTAGNCGSATSTLQKGYDYSTGGTTPEIKLDSTRLGLDIQDADTTIGSSNNFLSLRGPNSGGAGSLLVGFGIQGNLYMSPSTDRTDLVDINKQSTGGNLLTVDSVNARVGVNLGGTTLPSFTLDVGGTLNVSSATTLGSTLVVSGASATVGTTGQQGSLVMHDGNGQTASISVGSALVANTSIAIPTAVGSSDTFCLVTLANCAGSGANAALSNLASVAINTTLLPGAAGTINLGSGTLPFGDIFLAGTSGTPATNNFKITGASTGGLRTITLPNASGTVCINTNNCSYAPATGGTGYIQNGTAVQTSANFNIRSAATGSVGAVIQGASGQTADMLQLQKWNGSSATTVASFDSTGSLFFSNATDAGNRINIAAYDPGNGAAALVTSLSSGANSNSYGIAVIDPRSNGHHYPSIAVIAPDNSTSFGLTWAGDSSTARLTTQDVVGFTASLIVQSGESVGSGSASGDVIVKSGDGTGSNDSTGIVRLDSGSKSGTGTSGSVSVGDLNAPTIRIGNASSTTTIFNAANFTGAGVSTFQNVSDSTAAFKILNATGSGSTSLFTVDTTNSRVYVGDPTGDATGALLVLDTKNTSGDPTGVNGGMYYNSNSNTFRCYENGAWYDCLGRHKIVLASDVIDNSGACTIADVTGLSFTVASGASYRFHAQMGYTANATTSGSQWTATMPTTSFLSMVEHAPTSTTTESYQQVTSNDGGTCTTDSAATAGNLATVEGNFTTSASGTFQLRFAAETGTITAKAGSTLEWW